MRHGQTGRPLSRWVQLIPHLSKKIDTLHTLKEFRTHVLPLIDCTPLTTCGILSTMESTEAHEARRPLAGFWSQATGKNKQAQLH